MVASMLVIKATVRNGRIVVDEPTSLPDGREVELCVVNDDGMSEDERARLHASIARGLADGRAGREEELGAFLDQLDAES
jgi:hypothetical protein